MNLLLMAILAVGIAGFAAVLVELVEIKAILSKRTNRLNITFGADEPMPTKNKTNKVTS